MDIINKKYIWETDLEKLLEEAIRNDIMESEVSDIIKMKKNQKHIQEKYQDKIKYRKDGRQVYLYIGKKQYTATTVEELLSKMYELEFGKENYSMADIFPEFMIWKRNIGKVSGKTSSRYISNWNNYFKPYNIIHIPMKKLTSDDFKELFNEWTTNRSITLHEFKNLRSLINGIFTFAIIELKIIQFNVSREVPKSSFSFPESKTKETDVFSIDDRNIILEYLKDINDIYSLAIQFDFQQTIRIGELSALRWKHIHGNNIYIGNQYLRTVAMNDDLTLTRNKRVNVNYVKRKSEAGFRYLPLTNECKRILEKARKLNPHGEFIFMENDKQITDAKFNKYLKRICIECGVQPRTSHKIRFCVASIFYIKGIPLPIIQKMLGHTSLQMTLHYLRDVIKKDLPMEVIEKALNEPIPK